MKRVIVIPTYNEAPNIERLLSTIRNLLPETFILIVDDNSPDSTGAIVKSLGEKDPQISLLFREKKEGLGKAYLAAFEQILKDPEVEAIAMMDADFSHDPAALPLMFELLSKNDVVIGSRYVHGGKVTNWELWRRALSLGANLYCKMILGLKIWDITSGFYVMRRESLAQCDFSSIDVSGYAFQIEFKYLLAKSGAKIAELPITFANRTHGTSKMSGAIISEGIFAPWKMLFRKR
jgi:dolichol-phosphate mannosyltransferase